MATKSDDNNTEQPAQEQDAYYLKKAQPFLKNLELNPEQIRRHNKLDSREKVTLLKELGDTAEQKRRELDGTQLADKLIARIGKEVSPLIQDSLQETLKENPGFHTLLGDYLERIRWHSPETASHVEEVSILTARAAKKLADDDILSPQGGAQLIIAGMLHDTGKLQTPKEILDKHGALDEEERRQMNQHPIFSAINLDIHVPKDPENQAAQNVHGIVHTHHERLNGWGYPLLKEPDEIRSPEDRLFPIIDMVEALTGDRGYRKKNKTMEEALAIIREESDNSIDARIKRGEAFRDGPLKKFRAIAQRDDEQGHAIREILEQRGLLDETKITYEQVLKLGRPPLDKEYVDALVPVFEKYAEEKKVKKAISETIDTGNTWLGRSSERANRDSSAPGSAGVFFK